MKDFYKLSNFNKTLVRLTIAFLVYGYFCRIAGLYFFWESKTVGWAFLLVTIISVLRQRILSNKAAGKKTLSEKIFTAITVFILLVQGILFFVFLKTDAYKAAKHFLLTDKAISNEVGEVYNIFLVPVGGLSTSSSAAGQTGRGNLNFIVKGKSKFKDINLHLVKELKTDWTIVETK